MIEENQGGVCEKHMYTRVYGIVDSWYIRLRGPGGGITYFIGLQRPWNRQKAALFRSTSQLYDLRSTLLFYKVGSLHSNSISIHQWFFWILADNVSVQFFFFLLLPFQTNIYFKQRGSTCQVMWHERKSLWQPQTCGRNREMEHGK